MEMRWRQSITRRWAAVTAVAVAVAVAMAATGRAGAEPVAHAARACNISSVWYSLGPTYVENLNVSGTSCANGQKVIRAYNRCRLNSGGRRGRCHSSVRGFSCKETRTPNAFEFIGVARCTSGGRVVKFSYTQST